MKKAFWILTVLALLAVNTLAAVLYAGVPALDSGTGFISFSPFADIVWWGGVILLTGVPALVLGFRSRPTLPRVPRQIAPVAACLALQGALSLAILVLGPLFLAPFPWIAQIPFWGYAVGLSLLYLAAGAVWTGKRGEALGWTLLWCAAFTALFLVLGLFLRDLSHRKDGQMAAGRSARRLASCSSRSATVWGRKISGTPPNVIVSPSFTGAELSTFSPFTSVPPLEPRS